MTNPKRQPTKRNAQPQPQPQPKTQTPKTQTQSQSPKTQTPKTQSQSQSQSQPEIKRQKQADTMSFSVKGEFKLSLTEIKPMEITIENQDLKLEGVTVSMFDGESKTQNCTIYLRDAMIGEKRFEFSLNKTFSERQYAIQQNCWYSTHPSGKKVYLQGFDANGNELFNTMGPTLGSKIMNHKVKNPIKQAIQ